MSKMRTEIDNLLGGFFGAIERCDIDADTTGDGNGEIYTS